jgi:hypothetical protein
MTNGRWVMMWMMAGMMATGLPAGDASPAPTGGVTVGSTNGAPTPDWFEKIRMAFKKPIKTPEDSKQALRPPVTPTPRWPAREWSFQAFASPWSGVALVGDPVNREALFLGGHNGGMPFGTMGSWALAEDGKTWREMKFASAVLDPLREKAVAARKPAKDGEAAARNVYYAALEPAKETAVIRAEPAKLIAEAAKLAGDLAAALGAVKAEGWEKEAVAQSRLRAEKAAENLKRAKAALEAGTLDATVLKNCFDAQWALDEAASCLANAPDAREGAAAAYDPENKCVVFFGGSHHDYMTSDTWIYDCSKKAWRQVWPTTSPSARMRASFAWCAEKNALILSNGLAVLNQMVYQQGSQPAPAGEWQFDTKTCQWTGTKSAASGLRVYRTIVPGYNPCWYDEAARGDPKAVADWLAKLPPNTWTSVPMQPAPAPERDWGTARLDPDRDQIYRWTGGHCADPSSSVSTYHPGINRWSIPYVPEIGQKGMTFNGRPDCANHTYLHYAYDLVSKRLICPSEGGTGVYNPDLRDFEFSVDQPFNCHIYETCSASTPKGVILWGQGGQMWLFDYPGKAWKKFPVTGKPPAPVCDGSALCYDSKRDCLWMASKDGYGSRNIRIWRCNVKSGAIEPMTPANGETIGRSIQGSVRESVYVPTLDAVFFNNIINGKELAYDPEKNRWMLLGTTAGKEIELGTVGDTLNYDVRRDVVWNLGHFKKISVIRLDPKSLVISEDPGKQ